MPVSGQKLSVLDIVLVKCFLGNPDLHILLIPDVKIESSSNSTLMISWRRFNPASRMLVIVDVEAVKAARIRSPTLVAIGSACPSDSALCTLRFNSTTRRKHVRTKEIACQRKVGVGSSFSEDWAT